MGGRRPKSRLFPVAAPSGRQFAGPHPLGPEARRAGRAAHVMEVVLTLQAIVPMPHTFAN
jgi:hypothetical protein